MLMNFTLGRFHEDTLTPNKIRSPSWLFVRCTVSVMVIFNVILNIFEPGRVFFVFRFCNVLGASNRGKDTGSARTAPADEKRLSLLALIAFAHAP